MTSMFWENWPPWRAPGRGHLMLGRIPVLGGWVVYKDLHGHCGQRRKMTPAPSFASWQMLPHWVIWALSACCLKSCCGSQSSMSLEWRRNSGKACSLSPSLPPLLLFNTQADFSSFCYGPGCCTLAFSKQPWWSPPCPPQRQAELTLVGRPTNTPSQQQTERKGLLNTCHKVSSALRLITLGSALQTWNKMLPTDLESLWPKTGWLNF